MTGWYVSSIWVGHDNYKPLSSKTTGSSGALPIWKSYMTKIHEAKGLENRDIIEANPEDLGLVKVTTCAVSGQLATEACYNDSKGYGVVTDYWYEPTVPTVSCQMHQSVVTCTQTGMLATEYCPSTATTGVVVIPSGHPLSLYASDSQYGPVIAEYLGTASNLGYCTLHTSYESAAGGGWADGGGYSDGSQGMENALIPDARQLLQSAYDLMGSMDTSSTAYASIQSAAATLESILSGSNPGTADVAAGMAMLTQAMAGAY